MAAAYSENPSPSQSVKGSFTDLAEESAPGRRGNKENRAGGRRGKAGSETKYLEKQTHILLGQPKHLHHCLGCISIHMSRTMSVLR